jgi:recombination protein RecA
MSKEKEKKVKKVELSDALQKAHRIRDLVQKRFGQESIMTTDANPAKMESIPTGSLLLDSALGIGGVPKGRIIEIYGPEASGKTTLTLHLAAACQAKGGVVAFIDAEHALDPNYAKTIGVKMDELLLAQPDSGEQGLDIAEELVKTGEVDLIIVDSVAALTPQAELDGEMGDQQMGLHARMMSKGLRKITAIASKSKTTIVFINQLRLKIGFVMGNPETTTGGNALKFYASTRLDVRRVKAQNKDATKEGIMKVKIVKNKVAVPFAEVEIPVIYGQGINKTEELYEVAKSVCGLIETTGGSHYYRGKGKFKLEDGTEIKNDEENKMVAKFASNKDDAKQLLKSNEHFFKLLEGEVKKFFEDNGAAVATAAAEE